MLLLILTQRYFEVPITVGHAALKRDARRDALGRSPQRLGSSLFGAAFTRRICIAR